MGNICKQQQTQLETEQNTIQSLKLNSHKQNLDCCNGSTRQFSTKKDCLSGHILDSIDLSDQPSHNAGNFNNFITCQALPSKRSNLRHFSGLKESFQEEMFGIQAIKNQYQI